MKKCILLLIFLFAAGNLLASNMGFKMALSMVYTSGSPNPDWANRYWSSIPLFYTPANAPKSTNPEADLEDFCADLGGKTIVQKILYYDTPTLSTRSWSCTPPIALFAPSIEKSKGYAVVLASAMASGIVVGSHDDAYQFSLSYVSGSPNPDWANRYWLSIPYHINLPNAPKSTNTSQDLEDLCNSMGGKTVVQKILYYDTATTSTRSWSCTPPIALFAPGLDVQKAYAVVLASNLVNYSFPHY